MRASPPESFAMYYLYRSTDGANLFSECCKRTQTTAVLGGVPALSDLYCD
jgi:hypothetical protein